MDNVAIARAFISNTTCDPSVLVPCLALLNSISLKFLWDVVCQTTPFDSPEDSVLPRVFKEVLQSIGKSVLAIINSKLSSGVLLICLSPVAVRGAQSTFKRNCNQTSMGGNFD